MVSLKLSIECPCLSYELHAKRNDLRIDQLYLVGGLIKSVAYLQK